MRLAATITALGFFAASTARAQNILDPIPFPILPSGVVAELVDVTAAPVTAVGNARPRARLNFLHHAGDGSGRVFANDMRGRIYILRQRTLAATPFLDVRGARGASFLDDNPATNSELGVSTFAFHPDFARLGAPGWGVFYTVSTETTLSGAPDFPTPGGVPATHHDVLAEWRVDPTDPDRIDPGSRREVLRVAQPHVDHNMNQIAFRPGLDPDDADYANLYVGLGDGGNTWNVPTLVELDAHHTAQDLAQPFGKILRIDPLAVSGYLVPADNPFVEVPGALPEIWAFGFRNPQRFSWDAGDPAGPAAGRMLITDVGQRTCEEVNVGAAGANYGWSEREGTFVPNHFDQNQRIALPPDDASFGYTYPAAQYDRSEGFATVGGFVARGGSVPALEGHYVFGDLNLGRIFSVPVAALTTGANATIGALTLTRAGLPWTVLQVISDTRADMRFGVDQVGALFVLTKRDGWIRRLAAAGPPDTTAPTLAPTADVSELLPDGMMVPVTIDLAASDMGGGALGHLVTVSVDDGPAAIDDVRASPLFSRPVVDGALGRVRLGLRGGRRPDGQPRHFTITLRTYDGAGNLAVATVVIATSPDDYDFVYADVEDGSGARAGVIRCYLNRSRNEVGCSTRAGTGELVVYDAAFCTGQ